MQSVDLNNSSQQAATNVSALSTYNEVSKSEKRLRKSAGNGLSQSAEKLSSQLNSISNKQKRFERNVPNSMDQLLNLLGLTSGTGQQSTKFIRNLILQTAVKIEPEVKKIIQEESLKAVGCSQEQTYNGIPLSTLNLQTLTQVPVNQSIFVPIQSLDLITLANGMLKQNVNSPVGKIVYEKDLPDTTKPLYKNYGGKIGFPMNRALWDLTQSINQSFRQKYGNFYLGTSGQPLMDIQYSTTNEFGVTGNYFKVGLIDRSGNTATSTGFTQNNKISEFLSDYFSTVKLFEPKDIGLQIVQFLSKFISMQAQFGSGEISNQSKFYTIAARILGLCFDSRREIDVSGISKIAELDGVDDRFFELTEVDLRNLDLDLSNVQNGVVEFVECDNVKLPINFQNLTNQFLEFVDTFSGQTLDEQVLTIEKIVDSISQNPDWKIYGNLNFQAGSALSQNLIKNIAIAVVSAALSPKVLLPIFVMLQVVESQAKNNYNQAVTSANTVITTATTINSQVNNVITDSVSFLKKFKKFSIEVITKIGGIFIRTLFELLKKDILRLVGLIIEDISNSSRNKRTKQILRYVGIATQLASEIVSGISDYRKCKSLLDNINNLINIINGIPRRRSKIPLALAILSDFLPGESPERATINTIKYLQSLGIPTGVLPDGSPNLQLLYTLATHKGRSDEQAENGVSDVYGYSGVYFSVPR